MHALSYRVVPDKAGKPLVILLTPLGNGQEISPDALFALAKQLEDAAKMAKSLNTMPLLVDVTF